MKHATSVTKRPALAENNDEDPQDTLENQLLGIIFKGKDPETL